MIGLQVHCSTEPSDCLSGSGAHADKISCLFCLLLRIVLALLQKALYTVIPIFSARGLTKFQAVLGEGLSGGR